MTEITLRGLGPLDLAALVQIERGPIPLWPDQSADLNMNVLRFTAGTGVAEHVNAEVDVLLVAIDGSGVVKIASVEHQLHAGQAILIPKAMTRMIIAGDDGLSYLSCHRRRAFLWPDAARKHRLPNTGTQGDAEPGGR